MFVAEKSISLPKTREEVEEFLTEHSNLEYLRLIFTDILGKTKCVEVPRSQFQKALDGQVAFDGSSIDGFVRIEESDMYLKPDFNTFTWTGNTAQLISDVWRPSSDFKTHAEFEGCPRLTLKRLEEEALQLGFKVNIGPEPEFFLLERDGNSFSTHDEGGYFDLSPKDSAFEFRNSVVDRLHSMGFEVEAAHHEVAPGQHEIDFKYDAAVATADKLTYFKSAVKETAIAFGLHATFMPKPIAGVNGSGMHCHQSLSFVTTPDEHHKNAFYDAHSENGLSDIARWYIGGILKHAKALAFITNPLVNSYKRLVPGFEAPTNICWSDTNRSLLIRVPASREMGTRIELRMPDPSCNPYLAFSAMLAAGLDGVRNQIEPSAPVRRNMFTMSTEEREKLNIEVLPGTLYEAMQEFIKDDVITSALGTHIVEKLVETKTAEWQEYIQQVHQWEVETYLDEY